MFELRFKKFDFRGFMDFVLSLVDHYGLGTIRFYPDKETFFDKIQLTHISPTRNVNDKRGFVWAWRQKQKEVRRVTFEQFNKAGNQKIKMTIDLDRGAFILDEINGISPVIIEEELRGNIDIGVDSDYKTKKLETKIVILEFCLAFFLSICFTLIFSIIKIFNITFNWPILFQYFIMFFGLSLAIVYIILPIVEIIRRVGTNVKDVLLEFYIEFKKKSKLGKTGTIFSIIAGIWVVCQILERIASLLK